MRIIHHARATSEDILTHIVVNGSIRLDPPGIEFAVADIYTV